MAKKLHARRYAQAAFEIASENKQLDRWQSDLRKLATLSENAGVRAFLEAPRTRLEDKVRLITEQFRGIDPLVLNLAKLLVSRDIIGIIGDIADEYDRLLNEHRGVEEAEVLTAVPLSDEEKQELGSRIKDLLGKEIILKTQVEPALLGGVVIRVNDKLIDGSTRSRLLALKKELGGAVS